MLLTDMRGQKPVKISIDGPSGSGKSTVGNMLAQQLAYTFVDAGMLYRAVTNQVIQNNIDPFDELSVVKLARGLSIKVHADFGENNKSQILIEGEDVLTSNFHTEEINYAVPIIAAYPKIRTIVRDMQRLIADKGNCVLAGRDIGTVVLADADLKIYLDVTLEERVRRRYENYSKNQTHLKRDAVKEDLLRRDHLDSTRSESPLKIPKDAIVIRTDGMEPEEVVQYIINEFVICKQSN